MDDIEMAQMAKSPYVDSLPFPQTAHVLTVRSTKQHKHQNKMFANYGLERTNCTTLANEEHS